MKIEIHTVKAASGFRGVTGTRDGIPFTARRGNSLDNGNFSWAIIDGNYPIKDRAFSRAMNQPDIRAQIAQKAQWG